MVPSTTSSRQWLNEYYAKHWKEKESHLLGLELLDLFIRHVPLSLLVYLYTTRLRIFQWGGPAELQSHLAQLFANGEVDGSHGPHPRAQESREHGEGTQRYDVLFDTRCSEFSDSPKDQVAQLLGFCSKVYIGLLPCPEAWAGIAEQSYPLGNDLFPQQAGNFVRLLAKGVEGCGAGGAKNRHLFVVYAAPDCVRQEIPPLQVSTALAQAITSLVRAGKQACVMELENKRLEEQKQRLLQRSCQLPQEGDSPSASAPESIQAEMGNQQVGPGNDPPLEEAANVEPQGAEKQLPKMHLLAIKIVQQKRALKDHATARAHQAKVIRDLKNALAGKRRMVQKARKRLRKSRGRVADLSAALSLSRNEALELSARIADLNHSKSWRLLQRLQRARRRLAPPCTRRERAMKLSVRAVGVWWRQGTWAAVKKALRKVARLALRKGKAVQKAALRFPPFAMRRITSAAKTWLVPCLPRKIRQLTGDLFQGYNPSTTGPEVVLYADPQVLPHYVPRRGLRDGSPLSSSSIKVSLIATVRNEADHVQGWLNSLYSQTRLPDEVVITDCGSDDNTFHILTEFAKTSPLPLKIIPAPGSNIARGRNLAIRNTAYPLIACTDFGCLLDPNWLKDLLAPFEADPATDVSCGLCSALQKEPRDRLFSSFVLPSSNGTDPRSFLPSSCSLAFKKSLWARAGGYPEWLTDPAQDPFFALGIRRKSARWAFVPQAIVFKECPGSFKELTKHCYRSAKGEAVAGLSAIAYRKNIGETAGVLFTLAAALLSAPLGFVLGGAGIGLSLGLLGLSVLLALRFSHRRIMDRTLLTSLRMRLPAVLNSAGVLLSTTLGYVVGTAKRPAARRREREQHTAALRQLLAAHPERKGVIVYPPTHDWGFMFQRPHQVARSFAGQGYLYFYCTRNEIADTVVGFQEVEPGLFVCHVPLETFSILEKPVVYIGSPWHRSILGHFDRPQVVYDHYDDLEVSSGKVEDHLDLLRLAHTVVVTSRGLAGNVSGHRADALLLPNGVDFQRIRQNRPKPQDPAPPDWHPIADRGRPVIGYAGALASWFDYDLLSYLAGKRPDLDFVLLGVNYDGSLDRSNILGLPNVHWLGLKPYAELFNYVWRFDVGIIPFKINEITLATSPIKLFEYMACGKPVISTRLPECTLYPGVFVAQSSDEFERYLNDALAARHDAAYLSRIERVARENTWNSRVGLLCNRLAA